MPNFETIVEDWWATKPPRRSRGVVAHSLFATKEANIFGDAVSGLGNLFSRGANMTRGAIYGVGGGTLGAVADVFNMIPGMGQEGSRSKAFADSLRANRNAGFADIANLGSDDSAVYKRQMADYNAMSDPFWKGVLGASQYGTTLASQTVPYALTGGAVGLAGKAIGSTAMGARALGATGQLARGIGNLVPGGNRYLFPAAKKFDEVMNAVPRKAWDVTGGRLFGGFSRTGGAGAGAARAATGPGPGWTAGPGAGAGTGFWTTAGGGVGPEMAGAWPKATGAGVTTGAAAEVARGSGWGQKALSMAGWGVGLPLMGQYAMPPITQGVDYMRGRGEFAPDYPLQQRVALADVYSTNGFQQTYVDADPATRATLLSGDQAAMRNVINYKGGDSFVDPDIKAWAAANPDKPIPPDMAMSLFYDTDLLENLAQRGLSDPETSRLLADGEKDGFVAYRAKTDDYFKMLARAQSRRTGKPIEEYVAPFLDPGPKTPEAMEAAVNSAAGQDIYDVLAANGSPDPKGGVEKIVAGMDWSKTLAMGLGIGLPLIAMLSGAGALPTILAAVFGLGSVGYGMGMFDGPTATTPPAAPPAAALDKMQAANPEGYAKAINDQYLAANQPGGTWTAGAVRGLRAAGPEAFNAKMAQIKPLYNIALNSPDLAKSREAVVKLADMLGPQFGKDTREANNSFLAAMTPEETIRASIQKQVAAKLAELGISPAEIQAAGG